MTRKNYTTQIRVLLCQSCGAPLEVSPSGGLVACSYCRAQNQITGRKSAIIAPPSMPIDEHERIRRLRMQDGRPLTPPASLMPLLGGSGFHPAKVEEAFHVYRATRREVETTHSPEAAERLFFLTLIANNHLGQAGDEARRRAILETSLDAVDLPRHVQVLRCLLASASAKEGDVQSAEQWLQPCNPRSDEIESDSAFRVARAFVDTTRGDFHAVLHSLGTVDDAYPIADTWDPTCAVLRANALERLGDVQGAINALRARMAKESHGGRATMQAIITAHPHLGLCAQSFPVATQGHAHQAAQTASGQMGGAVGAIFFWTGIAVIVLGVVLAVGISIPMIAGGFASGQEIGMGAGIGTAAFSGGITLLTTVPLGGIFAFIGYTFRKKGQRAAWLRVNGLQMQGRVRGMQPTGTRINNVPMVRVEVEVSHPQHGPYVASFTQLYDASLASAAQPGMIVPLRVHPEQPSEIMLEMT